VKRPIVIALAAAALALAGCGGDDDDSSDGARESAAPATTTEKQAGKTKKPTPSSPGITVAVGESDFGSILFDGDDRAIYLFTKESSSRSECYGACAEAWPPVLSDGAPRAAGAAKAGLLGTTERTDGTTQVTYKGQPLYYYVDDPPGQVLCHNVEEFGGLWLVVDPAGDAVQ
jgi:predicted lipoprotein with Yx(FWY)xxD motif